MLQYLLNATAIWLISLVSYDIFLRRESYHSYNRFYLLLTFLLGGLLPLLQWQERLYTTKLQRPLEQIITVKQSIISASTPGNDIDWSLWLTIIYLTGAIIALVLLLADVLKMATLYRNGKKSIHNNWTIIETRKEHAPFSFFNSLFVCSKAQYSDNEWEMILVHEKRHNALLHFIDLLLMQFSKIIFWFHPLVYIYNKRLLLVHEYQADRVSAQQPHAYGQFLLEQALLQSAPVTAHSFNRSPIKNRIVMLTRRSSMLAKSKMLVFAPVALVCFLCFTKNVFSQRFQRNGNIVTYRGNSFEYGDKPRFDTFTLIDPTTGKESGKVTKRDPVPEKMNGSKIYKTNELTTQPQSYAQNGSIPDYLFRNLSQYLDKLPDGTCRLDINNIIIDPKGKIVYYEGIGISRPSNMKALEMNNLLEDKIDAIFHNAPTLKPGKVNNKNVAVLTDILFMAYEIEVKDHHSTVRQVWK